MLEKMKAHLAAGDRDRAREALRDAVLQVCVARFFAGWTRHPLLSPKSKAFVDAVRDTVDDAEAVAALRIPDEAHVNLAFERLLPDFALVLDEALMDAKHDLGAKASNVQSEGGRASSMLGWEAAVVAEVASEALKSAASSRLSALEDVRLADLDVPDDGTSRIEDDAVVFPCDGCGAERREPLGGAGGLGVCACGEVGVVPRVPLARMAAHLKQKRDTARGISRCRVCTGVIQLGKQGFMRAGFCGAYCAKRGEELFREYVARAGTRAGEEIVFACVCGQEHRAAEADVGTKRPCAACGIEVWVPLADAAKRPKGVGSCAHCGRVMKASAARCMYCGKPPV